MHSSWRNLLTALALAALAAMLGGWLGALGDPIGRLYRERVR